jgi:hypothetical protein
MSPSSKPIASIIPLCRNCIHYKLSEKANEPAKCTIFYRQHPTYQYSYFETAEVYRKDTKFCGPDGRWFLGKGNIRIVSLEKKQECYDK